MTKTPIRVLSIFGTRPEAIKMAPVVRALEAEAGFDSTVCVTAQHRGMLDQVLDLFEIRPEHDLDLMRDDQSPTQVASAVLAQLEPILETERPDWVLVQGDTTTTMAASLVAFYAGVKVRHVEAGLRTGDKWAPFPEEINRRLTSVVADLHFAPTERSKVNLLREGIREACILVTGNTVIDALHWALGQRVPDEVRELFDQIGLAPDRGGKSTQNRKLILVTAHRRENFGKPLENIFKALIETAEEYSDAVLVYPVHPNPNVREPAYRMLPGAPNIHLIEPLDHLPMVHLMSRASLVLTDSGGIQEETPSLGIPVLVVREETERPEAIEAGFADLVGTDPGAILDEAQRLLENPDIFRVACQAGNPFGDRRASGRILRALLHLEIEEALESPDLSHIAAKPAD